ncbi:hypothetical protein DMENIID0001_091320 [Sergentomyia squamirostris]
MKILLRFVTLCLIFGFVTAYKGGGHQTSDPGTPTPTPTPITPTPTPSVTPPGQDNFTCIFMIFWNCQSGNKDLNCCFTQVATTCCNPTNTNVAQCISTGIEKC